MSQSAFDKIAQGMREALEMIESGAFDAPEPEAHFTLEDWWYRPESHWLWGIVRDGHSKEAHMAIYDRAIHGDISHCRKGDIVHANGERIRLGDPFEF